MKEEFLHYLWRYRLYEASALYTSSGRSVRVEDPGHPHQDGGPDLRQARIRIGNTLWAGHVEIHFRSSDWYRHGHHQDPAYDNVILHVVLKADTSTRTSSGTILETLELEERIPQGLVTAYERFMNERKKRVPCEGMIHEVPPLLIGSWLDRLVVERLQRRCQKVHELYELSGKDLRTCFYCLLGRYFGGKVNASAFEQLCGRTPLSVLLKERASLLAVEAILFGQAGLLPQKELDERTTLLRREFGHFKKKYGLRPMNPSAWRSLRLRPAAHPQLRIAQFAGLIHRNGDPWHILIALEKGKQVQGDLEVTASHYWKEHYKFGKVRKQKRAARVGKEMARKLLINAFTSFLFFLGEKEGDAEKKERAIGILERMKPEDDRIQRYWKRLGVLPENASRSQGAIELMENYCDPRKCLHCAIGDRILKKQIR